jgi:N-methylhydantoinase A/oxoprolinase/acetone carboxylase beta subunit
VGHLISIDNGGTFTDVCVISGERALHAKTLTTPHDLSQCFFEALTEAARDLYGAPEVARLLAETDYVRYSTTAGTNAIVERRGPRVALLTSHGVSLTTLDGPARELATAIVGDRVATIDPVAPDLQSAVIATINQLAASGANRLVVCLGGQDGAAQERALKRIVLDRYPRHLLGALPVLFSHELVADADDARRAWTAVLNAFLHPTMERFLYAAEQRLREHRALRPLLVYSNDGSSTRVAKTVALRTYGSGPRGGVEGVAVIARHYQLERAIGIDIGGTTTDISVVDGAVVPETPYGAVDGVPLSFPLVVVQSVGAGGSSVMRVDAGVLRVGPESVGAAPGPACFGRGGEEATITDAYLLSGLLDPATYSGGSLSLDRDRAAAAVTTRVATPLGIDVNQAILVMEKAYEETIGQAIREEAGDVSGATLVAFGGAGPMSACGVADALGCKEVMVPRLAAVFSAFGISFSDVAHTHESLAAGDVDAESQLGALREKATRGMFAEGFAPGEIVLDESISWLEGTKVQTALLGKGRRVPPQARTQPQLRWRVRATRDIPHLALRPEVEGAPAKRVSSAQVRRILGRDGKWSELPIFVLSELAPGDAADGPVLIEDRFFTCRVEKSWSFRVTANGDLALRRA